MMDHQKRMNMVELSTSLVAPMQGLFTLDDRPARVAPRHYLKYEYLPYVPYVLQVAKVPYT